MENEDFKGNLKDTGTLSMSPVFVVFKIFLWQILSFFFIKKRNLRKIRHSVLYRIVEGYSLPVEHINVRRTKKFDFLLSEEFCFGIISWKVLSTVPC
jgi:hypothetical protein